MKSDTSDGVWKDASGERLYLIINYNSGLHSHSCLGTPTRSLSLGIKPLPLKPSFWKSKCYVNLRKSSFIYGFIQQVYVRTYASLRNCLNRLNEYTCILFFVSKISICDLYFGLTCNIHSSCADPLYHCICSFVAILSFI